MDLDAYQLMEDLGDHKVRSRIIELRNRGTFSDSHIGSVLVSDAGGQLVRAVEAWCKDNKNKSPNTLRALQLFNEIGVRRACAVAMRFLVDRLSSPGAVNTIGTLRSSLAARLQEEHQFHLLVPEFKFHWGKTELQSPRPPGEIKSRIRRSMLAQKPELVSGWDRKDGYLLAGVVIDFAIRECRIFETRIERRHLTTDVRKPAKIQNVVYFTAQVAAWLEDKINWMRLSRPATLPVTHLPGDWGSDEVGGGFTQGPMALRHLMSSRAKVQADLLDESDAPLVYEAVNHIQATAWEINPVTHLAFEAAVSGGWSEAGIASVEPVKPVRDKTIPDGPEGKIRRRTHARAMRAYKVDLDEFRRNRLRLARTLSISEIYEGIGSFHFVHRLDFRGRCYPSSAGVSYQGPDYQRGMLRFAAGASIKEPAAREAFLIHGANCWGIDKVPFQQRMEWVEQNRQMIVDCALDPLDCREWVHADKPFQFLGWAEEYEQLIADGDVQSRIAINSDGSNNGLQIYSLLLRDHVGGRATNCIPGAAPRDIYQDVADLTTRKMVALAATVGDDAVRAADVLAFCKQIGAPSIPRAAVKRPVMTLPYGATHYSCQNYLCDWYHDYVRGKDLADDKRSFRKGSYETMTWLGGKVWDAIGETVISAVDGMNFLREIAGIASEQNKHLTWTTPLGHKIAQNYLVGTQKTINLAAGGKVTMRIWEENDKVHAKRSANGFCPNFIHSLDASAMMLTAVKAKHAGIKDIQMIHDSFGCRAADAPVLGRLLREAYTEIFTPDVLGLNYAHWQATLGDLPPLPQYGSLDISELRNSTYFFA